VIIVSAFVGVRVAIGGIVVVVVVVVARSVGVFVVDGSGDEGGIVVGASGVGGGIVVVVVGGVYNVIRDSGIPILGVENLIFLIKNGLGCILYRCAIIASSDILTPV
jgi:hypothetical protein